MARLRIIAGEFGGRFIDATVGKGTHPMGDRVRSALFSSLDSRDVLSGARVLDAFAGTGAIGFEALSRGASDVIFIEKDRYMAKVIKNNIELLGVGDRAKVINASVSGWIDSAHDEEFDLIFADPPYHKPQFSTVWKLLGVLKNKGLMILSYSGRLSVPIPKEGVVVVDDFRSYGEATLSVFRQVINDRNDSSL